MSFNTKYPNRKDHRKEYFDSRSVSHSCRNHGSCDYCKNNRTFSNKKREEMFNDTYLDVLSDFRIEVLD